MAKWSPKDPKDVRYYWVDFRPVGLVPGETITDVVVLPPPDQDPPPPYEALEVVSAEATLEDQWVLALLAGGWVGKHVLNYHITTSAGQEFDLDKTLEVKERKQ